ncbi:MAG: hypothetical protein WBD27_07215 [Pyrinomonadaceae bacterium]
MKKKYFIMTFVLTVCFVTLWSFLRGEQSLVFADNEQMSAVIVFRDETLNDLARLLKPMKITSALGKDIYLQDAAYIGSSNGRAKIITFWLSKTTIDSTTILPADITNKPIQTIADELLKGKMADSTFAIIPVEIEWKDWILSVSRNGTGIVSGSESNRFQRIISTSPTLISKVNTRSINFPIGYNQEKMASMQPWFETDQIIIEIKPSSDNAISTSRPNIDELNRKAGVLLGTGFLNDIYFSDFKERIFTIGKNDSTSRLKSINIKSSSGGRVLVSGSIDVPPPATVKFQAFFDGEDIKFLGITPTDINCGSFSSMQCLQLNLKYKAGALGVTGKFKNTMLRNDEVQTIGNFYIGAKSLSGTAKIDKVLGGDGKLILFGKVRLNGGHNS